jgi:hypothetical protein
MAAEPALRNNWSRMPGTSATTRLLATSERDHKSAWHEENVYTEFAECASAETRFIHQQSLILSSLSSTRMHVNRCSQCAAPEVKEKDMKGIRQAVVAAVLSVGLVSVAEAHVFVGLSVGVPAVPMMPMVAAVPVAPVAVYAPPPAPIYYAPPPPVYAPPVVVGYYGRPGGWYGHYGYGYGYWR